MVRFVLIVSVLLNVMVAPDRFGSNVMTAPPAALVMADRSVPGPLSALLVTTCAEAVAPPAKTSMSRIDKSRQRAFRVFIGYWFQHLGFTANARGRSAPGWWQPAGR